jgi:hemerythrin superfamily protein
MSDDRSGEGFDVVDEILLDHEEIERLLAEVAETTDGPRRAEAFEQLARLLQMHEAAEQAVVHPEMEQLEDAEAVAEDRLTEETRADELLDRLRTMGVDDPNFDSLFGRFRDSVLRHAEQEEREEHPKLRAEVDTDRLSEMADQFVEAEDEADPYQS